MSFLNRRVLDKIPKEEPNKDCGKEAEESNLEESDSEIIGRIRANLANLKRQN